MNSIKELLNNYSYPLHRDELHAGTHEEFVKIKVRKQLEAERIRSYVEKLEVQKISLEKSWNSFVYYLKGNQQFKRVTDRTKGAHTHSFKLEILLQGKLGIGFCLSQIGKFIGIYFTSQEAKSLIPLKECNLTFFEVSKDKKNPFISYFPYSLEQVEMANKLIKTCENYFPEFQLFNNFFASTEIEDIVIDGRNVYKSDLFQILFANNLVVI